MSTEPSYFTQLLFTEFPEWRSLTKVEMNADRSEYIVIEVPPPIEANVEHGLVIDTANNEITVGFDTYHSHFDKSIGYGSQFGAQAAIEFIKHIIRENVAVASWWHGDQWRGSAQLEAGAHYETPSWMSAKQYDRVRVRSWNGTFNLDSDV